MLFLYIRYQVLVFCRSKRHKFIIAQKGPLFSFFIYTVKVFLV